MYVNLSWLYYEWLFLHNENFFLVSFGGTANYERAVQKVGMEKGKVERF